MASKVHTTPQTGLILVQQLVISFCKITGFEMNKQQR